MPPHLNEVEAVQHVHLTNIPCMVRTAGRYLRRKIDALDQWCLRMLLGIVRNDDVRRLTNQPKLTAIIQTRRLTLFGHIIRMDDNSECQEDPVSLPSGRLEKTTRSSPHHVA